MNEIRNCLILFLFLFCSCQQKTDRFNKNKQLDNILRKKIEVNTTIVFSQDFNRQLIANGNIESTQKSELHFKISNQISKIKVKNGQKVIKGQVLALLKNSLLKNQLEKSEIDLLKAKIKLKEERINYGISKNTEEVGLKLLKTLEIKSGVLEAKNTIENAKILYNQTILKAPFFGVIANIETKEGNFISSSDVFCTIVNYNNLEVSFSILENEYEFVSNGQEIKIQSFANKDKTYKGFITEINPLVDENGLFKIKAEIAYKDMYLLDGMHVKVFINNPLRDVIVIPKKALVLRSNREVVFTAKKGLAKWNYVEIIDENSDNYAIGKGLNVSDTIIVSGNLNLSHDAKITTTFLHLTISKNK